MDLKAIKQVIELMKRSELTEFEFEEEGFKLRLSRQSDNPSAPIIQSVTPASIPVATPQQAPASTGSGSAEAQTEDPNVTVIKSPMVGTFYRAPSPESPNFVEAGTKVSPDSIVCIVEAMKVMNEIQSEVSGTITEVLVENGDAIEFGQPLFIYKKA